MSRMTGILLALLLLAGVVMGENDLSRRLPATLNDGSGEISAQSSATPWTGSFQDLNELDDIVGDTLIVATTYWDQQHNAQVGRMITYYPGGDDDDPVAYVVFTKLSSTDPNSSRHVAFARVLEDGEGGLEMEGGGQVEWGNRSGYTTLAMHSTQNEPYPAFHHRTTTSGDFVNGVGVETIQVGPGFFDLYNQPGYGERPHVWPHAVFGSENYIHVISHDQRPEKTDPMEITYYRWLYDPTSRELNAAMGDLETELLITDDAMNISGDIVTSLDGQKVAIGLTMDRSQTIGEIIGEGTQWNNDLWVFESLDGGATWDLDNPIEVTRHISPDEELFPDTIAMKGDTLRPHSDCSLVYDGEGKLHAVFTEEKYDAIRDQGYYMSRVYHWMLGDDGQPIYTQIADRSEFTVGQPEQWGNLADRPCISYDTDTGRLWCIIRMISSAPDTNDRSSTTDKANGDIYVTASHPGQYFGLLWEKPVNITNTIYTEDGGAAAGENRSEIDPSMALNCEGDYLHIFYEVDRDPGTGVAPTEAVGEVTENPMVYHRVAKQMLLDIFEENHEWIPNYPLRVDSLGFWDYSATVGEQQPLQPDQFDLGQNYPNPFNPSTQIAFNLRAQGHVTLTVYDVLGREVATLLNRKMNAGDHKVSFFGNDLPSGVYFYKLTSGEHAKVRKMVLMK